MRHCMDDATMKHLVNRRVTYVKPTHQFDIKYKQTILDLTHKLMENKLSGSIKEAFEVYASECISYSQQQEVGNVVHTVLECDKLMFPPKQITIVKQKNIRQMYEKNKS